MFVRLATRSPVAYTVLHQEAAISSMSSNLSGGGVSFVTHEAIPAGTRLKVAVGVPGRDRPVEFVAEVVWSQAVMTRSPSSDEQTAEVGVRYIQISPDDQELIMRYVSGGMRRPQLPASSSDEDHANP